MPFMLFNLYCQLKKAFKHVGFLFIIFHNVSKTGCVGNQYSKGTWDPCTILHLNNAMKWVLALCHYELSRPKKS